MFNPIHKIRDQYTDTVTELKKCSWPTWRELWESTVIVIISAAILSLFVFVIDFAVQIVIRWLA